jgi:hypothetical protein
MLTRNEIESNHIDLFKTDSKIILYLQFDQMIEFDIKIKDLPRSSKLCICFYYTNKKRNVSI